MKINESELSREMDAISDSKGASSFEDFWMFLAFAMVLVAFVLMGYVSYLRSIEIDHVRKIVDLKGEILDLKEKLKEEPEAVENAINVYVHKDAETGKVYLTIDDDDTRLSYKELPGAINSREFKENSTVVFFVHAPGEYTYEEVFNVNIVLKSSDVLGDRAVKKVVGNAFDPSLFNKQQ